MLEFGGAIILLLFVIRFGKKLLKLSLFIAAAVGGMCAVLMFM